MVEKVDFPCGVLEIYHLFLQALFERVAYIFTQLRLQDNVFTPASKHAVM